MFCKHVQTNLLYPFLYLATRLSCCLLSWLQLSSFTAKEQGNQPYLLTVGGSTLLPWETGVLSATEGSLQFPSQSKYLQPFTISLPFPKGNKLQNCFSPQPPHGSQSLLNSCRSGPQRPVYVAVFLYGFPLLLVSPEIMSNWSQLNSVSHKWGQWKQTIATRKSHPNQIHTTG